MEEYEYFYLLFIFLGFHDPAFVHRPDPECPHRGRSRRGKRSEAAPRRSLRHHCQSSLSLSLITLIISHNNHDNDVVFTVFYYFHQEWSSKRSVLKPRHSSLFLGRYSIEGLKFMASLK